MAHPSANVIAAQILDLLRGGTGRAMGAQPSLETLLAQIRDELPGALGGASAHTDLTGVAADQHHAVGLALAGSNTVEASTTSITAVDVLTVSGLTIPVGTPFLIVGSYRKTDGAAVNAALGLKLNSTVVVEASISADVIAALGASNQAESGAFSIYVGPRTANYLRGLARSDGGLDSASNDALGVDADMPVAEITDVIIRGISGNALVTLAVSEVFIYTLPTP